MRLTLHSLIRAVATAATVVVALQAQASQLPEEWRGLITVSAILARTILSVIDLRAEPVGG